MPIYEVKSTIMVFAIDSEEAITNIAQALSTNMTILAHRPEVIGFYCTFDSADTVVRRDR